MLFRLASSWGTTLLPATRWQTRYLQAVYFFWVDGRNRGSCLLKCLSLIVTKCWDQQSSRLWSRVVLRWQRSPLRSCRRWEMMEGRTEDLRAVAETSSIFSQYILTFPLCCCRCVFQMPVCGEACRVIAKLRWRDEGQNSALCLLPFSAFQTVPTEKHHPQVWVPPTIMRFLFLRVLWTHNNSEVCLRTQLARRKAVLESFRTTCSEPSLWRLLTMAGMSVMDVCLQSRLLLASTSQIFQPLSPC